MALSITPNNAYSYMDETNIHPLLKCGFCKKPFVDPVSTQTGDRFCLGCIMRILQRPHSDEDTFNNIDQEQQVGKLRSTTPVTERLVLDMLNSLLVRCQKCGLINLKRGELEEHETQECTQSTVCCSAVDIKCPWAGARDQLEDHEEECKFLPLRSALEFMLNERQQLTSRVDSLEAEVNELRAGSGISNLNINS